jgi:hypothetical protein
MHTVTSSYTITVFARVVFDDVATGVSRSTIVGDMLRGRGRPVPLGMLRMIQGLSLL